MEDIQSVIVFCLDRYKNYDLNMCLHFILLYAFLPSPHIIVFFFYRPSFVFSSIVFLLFPLLLHFDMASLSQQFRLAFLYLIHFNNYFPLSSHLVDHLCPLSWPYLPYMSTLYSASPHFEAFRIISLPT